MSGTGPDVAGAQGLARGTIKVLAAEGLLIPAGVVTAAYLGRSLGPAGYGLYSVAASLVVTLEWAIAALFNRTIVKLVSESADWKPVGASLVRLQTGVGAALGLLLWLGASRLAALFSEPQLAPLLQWFALEVPIAAASNASRNVLTGRGRYGARALAGAARSVSRPIFVIAFVAAGWSIAGAVVGSVVSTLAAYLVVQALARVPWRAGGRLPLRHVGRIALPMFVVALGVRFIDKLGLIATKLLGGSGQEAGFYAAAQNFSLAPSLFAMSLTPLLLASVASAYARREPESAERLGREGYRATILLMPWAGLLVGAAPEILRFVYGAGFEPAASLAGPLVIAGLAFALVSVSTALLLAGDRARLASTCLWPVLPAAVVAHALVVPAYGPFGAALVTAVSASVSLGASLVVVRATLGISPPMGSALRSSVVTVVTVALAAGWSTQGPWLLVKAIVGSAVAIGLLTVAGELSRGDFNRARTVLGFRASSTARPGTTT